MGENNEQAWLRACQRQFELHLKWGPISQWSQRDFENLSELISEKTGILVSVTTLKRALGRVKFQGMPFQTTLNAMVQFLGHTDWAHFKSHPEFLDIVKDAPVMTEPGFGSSTRRFWLGFAFFAVLNAGLWLWFLNRQTVEKEVDDEKMELVRFHTEESMADSVPHQVNLEYSVPSGLWRDLLLVSFG